MSEINRQNFKHYSAGTNSYFPPRPMDQRGNMPIALHWAMAWSQLTFGLLSAKEPVGFFFQAQT